MSKFKKLIFVCTGNTCRSPMAETIYKNLDQEDEIQVTSRGIVVLFNEPINSKAELILNKYNLDPVNHVARGLKKQDIDEETLILTMTNSHKNNILEQFPDASVWTIKEFVGEEGDVTDPYGGSLLEYEETYMELSRLVKKTMYKLRDISE